MQQDTDARQRALSAWLDASGVDVKRIEPASGDASFRRYFRVRTATSTWIAMDAPPEQEDCGAFVRIAGYLRAMELNAPRIVRADLGQGFLLLDDLGDTRYLAALCERPQRAAQLYDDALDALLRMQHAGARYQSALPPYDRALLEREVALFRDWLCGRHLGITLRAADETRWRVVVDYLVDAALTQPRVFVHRDYHSRNLMVCERGNPGILDFQDAVEGPVTYDLVSLLKDCYIAWPEEEVRRRAGEFFAASRRRLPPDMTLEAFLCAFDLMGVQRHLKAAGIFARLEYRDGKSHYLADVPRTLGYVSAIAPRYPELAFLARLVDERCLPGFEEGA